YFGAADAFVLPTIYDPLPNAALEAMACGLPVITTTKSGAAELVVAGEAGYVCASRDSAALAAHMQALEDPLLRERRGANARRTVLPLSPSAMTLALVLLYKQLLEASAEQRRRLRSSRTSASPEGTQGSAPAQPSGPGPVDPAAHAEAPASPPDTNVTDSPG